jgi:hypothetical protein
LCGNGYLVRPAPPGFRIRESNWRTDAARDIELLSTICCVSFAAQPLELVRRRKCPYISEVRGLFREENPRPEAETQSVFSCPSGNRAGDASGAVHDFRFIFISI